MLASSHCSMSQIVEKYCENRSVGHEVLSDFVLPSEIDEMSFAGGRLHFASGGMLFSAVAGDGSIGFAEVDTSMLEIDSKMTYAVEHIPTGRLYITRRDSKGNSYLFERYEKKAGKYAVRRIKPGGFSFTIEHPVFSSDGRVMVFSSNCPLGFGGLDLWYSEWKNDEWQFPQNMGYRINTEGNEIMPAIHGDFLMFSSDGRVGGYGGYDIYASRLVAAEQTGDTVTMFPIGRCAVYSMHKPFCSSGDDVGLTLSDNGTRGWWLSRDSEGKQRLNSFSGRLDCVRLSGTISGQNGMPVEGASVVVRTNGKDAVTVDADGNGDYTVFLQPGMEYELVYVAPEHFQLRHNYVALRGDENSLYFRDTKDVTLNAFVVGEDYRYGDLFSSSVGSELSSSGRTRMDAVARFLTENPNLKLRVVSSFNQSADIPFCNLVNQSRLRAITEYLKSKGVALTSIETATGVFDGTEDDEDVSMLSAVAVSSRTVSFVFER